eukprot:1798745-Prymnesium_polylepis.1
MFVARCRRLRPRVTGRACSLNRLYRCGLSGSKYYPESARGSPSRTTHAPPANAAHHPKPS